MVVAVQHDTIDLQDLPSEVRAQDNVAFRPRRERRRTVADDLYSRLTEQRESFWSTVYPMYMAREITRAHVRDVVRRGLEEARLRVPALHDDALPFPEHLRRRARRVHRHLAIRVLEHEAQVERLRVPRDDASIRIDADEHVVRRIHDQSRARFAFRHTLERAAPLVIGNRCDDEVADRNHEVLLVDGPRPRAADMFCAEHAERQRIADARIALIDELRKTHGKLAEKMIPIADDVAFTLAMALETAADGQDPATIHKTLMGLADNELGALQAVLALRAESNLTLGILVEANNVYDQRVYHQHPAGRGNALWMFEPVDGRPDVYRIKDVKHNRYLVAGDVYDGNVYHQLHQNRENACWRVTTRPPIRSTCSGVARTSVASLRARPGKPP